MRCAWQAYINLLPHWMRQDVDRYGREALQELRIRLGAAPLLVFQNHRQALTRTVTECDISFIINAASEYSPWAATTVSQGYLTATGGHRIGVCGVCTITNGKISGISKPTSLCLRVARDFPGIAGGIGKLNNSLLVIGPPGSGKTTLLRDLVRYISDTGQGSVSVVDEREEIFPLYAGQACFPTGSNTDIISGCSKSEGITAVLRSMSPVWIAVDEITAQNDCEALLHAGWCGVNLLATAHAGSLQDLRTRPVYKALVESGLVTNVLVMNRNKSWQMERIQSCY